MKALYVAIAVVAVLLAGLAVGALTGGDDEQTDSGKSAVTRAEDAGTGTAGDSAPRGETGDEGSAGDDGAAGEGTERAPESADDPRPEAPDDVIGDRPGAGGDHDPGE